MLRAHEWPMVPLYRIRVVLSSAKLIVRSENVSVYTGTAILETENGIENRKENGSRLKLPSPDFTMSNSPGLHRGRCAYRFIQCLRL